jgi:hypothetical protein
MINGSPLAPADILGALTERPTDASLSGILEQVRHVESASSKAALITAAAAQFDPSSEAAALADVCPLVANGDLVARSKAELLDGIALLMVELTSRRQAYAERRRTLVLGIGELLRIAAQGGAGEPLLSRLRGALVAAASRGSIVGFGPGERIPGAA